jgi:hypothetical protein
MPNVRRDPKHKLPESLHRFGVAAMIKSGTTAYSRLVLDLSNVPTVDEFLMQLFEELVRDPLG